MISSFLVAYIFISPVFGINYFRCENSQDCVKAYGGCGRYLSVHRRYRDLYQAKAKEGDKVSACRKPEPKDELKKMKGEPYCIQNHCQLIVPEDQSQ